MTNILFRIFTAAILIPGILFAQVPETPFFIELRQSVADWNIRQSKQVNELMAQELRADISPVQESLVKSRLQSLKSRVPLEYSEMTAEYIRLMTEEMRIPTGIMLAKGRFYIDEIKSELARKEMPAELAYLPAALSAFRREARNLTGGSGIWQIRYHPAIRYGLNVTREVDERRIPAQSHGPALKYIQYLYSIFDDWKLAITAYGSSAAVVKNAIRDARSSDFSAVRNHLPEEYRNLYPLYVACAYVFEFADEHSLYAEPLNCEFTGPVYSPKGKVKIEAVCSLLEMDEEMFRSFNPVYRSDYIPENCKYGICLPEEYSLKFMQIKDSLYSFKRSENIAAVKPGPVNPDPTDEIPEDATVDHSEEPEPGSEENSADPDKVLLEYKIVSGDNLSVIAELFDVSVKNIQSWNGLNSSRIRADDILKIYVTADEKEKYEARLNLNPEKKKEIVSQSRPAEIEEEPGWHYYTVKRGDTLWEIAARFEGVSDKDLMKLNDISEEIRPGQKIKIRKR